MNVTTLLAQLSRLETALKQYSYQELSVADATVLKHAFADYRKDIEAKLWAAEEKALLRSVSFPAKPNVAWEKLLGQTDQTNPNQKVSSTSRNMGSILLAEHDTCVAAFFIKHLHNAGYDVLWASNSSMAKTLIMNGEADAVICSTYSRNSFGKSTLNFLRKERNSDIPVIIVAGGEHSDALRDTIALGADDYLVQHITAAELIGKVERVIQ
ncbi:MAG: response regulator transcription factor [Chitinophagales bacterium]|nr:response regulator transcription factor [Chitinophagales bacterium]